MSVIGKGIIVGLYLILLVACAMIDRMDTQMENEIEAAVLNRLLAHLEKRSDVQNIDLMNLAGFCRNCLSKWYEAEAAERGLDVSREAARERIYGMPYDTWKQRHQEDATPEQVAAFEQVMANPDLTS